MIRDVVETLKVWAKPPSETEETKGSNAARMINDALRSHPGLEGRRFKVYATGSYRNNTNVRLDSDIDIAVVNLEAVFNEFQTSQPTRESLGLGAASYTLDAFRGDVEKALVKKFGRQGVSAGDKTFNIHENSYRLDADVTAFCMHRLYTGERTLDGSWAFLEGVETRSTSQPSRRIVNWHEQHYERGVERNTATRRRFKRVTRILKRYRNHLREHGTAADKSIANRVPSFLIECLVFNCSDGSFNREEGSYFEDTKAVVGEMYHRLQEDDDEDYPTDRDRMREVNLIKYLFHDSQPWTPDDAMAFLVLAWRDLFGSR